MATKDDVVALSLRMPKDQHRSLTLLSAVSGKPVTTLINEAVEKTLSETPGLSELAEHARQTGELIKDGGRGGRSGKAPAAAPAAGSATG